MVAQIDPEELFGQAIVVAAKLPGVRVDRDKYLSSALKRYCSPDQLRHALESSPAAAGVAPEALDRAARAAIKFETTKVSTISAAAGIPGGFAMLGTVPADTAQYFGHMIRVAQKLAYLYGWPDLFGDGDDDMDDATKNVLILFLGVMLGTQLANGGVSKLSAMIAGQVAKKLPQQALTQGVIYPIVKKVAAQLGVRMTRGIFAAGVAKAIPVVGAVLSGGLTLATFLPMSLKLKKHLSASDLARPTSQPQTEARAWEDDAVR